MDTERFSGAWADRESLAAFEMCFLMEMEKISLVDKVINKEVLQKYSTRKQEYSIFSPTIGHIMRHELLKEGCCIKQQES